jgi:xanthine dehydrogenase iron-sulfur cluster and FAD-binding subunit A
MFSLRLCSVFGLHLQNDYFATFKQSPRRDLSLGDVTAAVGLRLQTDSDIIEKISLSVGGVALPSLRCVNAVNKMIGRSAVYFIVFYGL